MQQLTSVIVFNFYLNAYDTPLIRPNGSGFSGQDQECMFLRTMVTKTKTTYWYKGRVQVEEPRSGAKRDKKRKRKKKVWGGDDEREKRKEEGVKSEVIAERIERV